ncbi:hypothetical protein O9993_05880 [Vibrio lentus]|nr:hypothetical protein [Vibrio lentus]
MGKTAVVEGLALRIAADEVQCVTRCTDSLSRSWVAASWNSVKGEFENRLKRRHQRSEEL